MAAILAASLGVGACTPSVVTNPLPAISNRLPHWFSSSETASAAPAGPSMDQDCPIVEVRRGASTLQAASASDSPTPNDVHYQLTFTEFARQCTLVGSTVRMRVGVQGRVIVGPQGAPDQVDIPIRYAVIREGVEPKTIVTKFRSFPQRVPASAESAVFTDIEDDLSFPLPSQAELQTYVVYVGFDEVGDPKKPRPAAKKKVSRKK